MQTKYYDNFMDRLKKMTYLTEEFNEEATLTISTSNAIDFPFWILLQDGLHAPPFDKHTGGNQNLQSLGMTTESWYKWLNLILIYHDARLGWHILNIDAEVHKKVESFKQTILLARQNGIENNTVFDQAWHDEQYEYYSRLLIRQEQSYQEAIADYQSLDTKFIRNNVPPYLYLDNLQITEALNVLWDDYKSNQDANKFIEPIILTPFYWDTLENLFLNKDRQILLVNYPVEIEVFIPPIFLIVTVPNCPVEQSHIHQRFFDILQKS